MSYNITQQYQNQGKINKLILVVGILLICGLSWNVLRLFSQYIGSRQLLKREQLEKEQLLTERENLRYRASRAQTDAYVEERARQLALSKEHEYIVVAQYPSPSPTKAPVLVQRTPPYQAWLQVFSRP